MSASNERSIETVDPNKPTKVQQTEALAKLDASVEAFQKEGKLLESLQCMEKSLVLRGHMFGLDSIEVFNACKSVGEMCNFLAMSYLQEEEFDLTLELLKKAEVLTERHTVVRAITYNNMGCYYRKRGKLRTALGFVRKALDMEAALETPTAKSADTHLNMCAILSEIGRHDQALQHAHTSLKLLLLELFGDNNAEGAPAEDKKLPADRVAVLAIAYHNLAVQQECMRKYQASLESYQKALKVVTTHLGDKHPLVKTLTDSYCDAKQKLEKSIEKQNEISAKFGRRRDSGYDYKALGRGGRRKSPPLTHQELHLLATVSSGDLNKDGGEGKHDGKEEN